MASLQKANEAGAAADIHWFFWERGGPNLGLASDSLLGCTPATLLLLKALHVNVDCVCVYFTAVAELGRCTQSIHDQNSGRKPLSPIYLTPRTPSLPPCQKAWSDFVCAGGVNQPTSFKFPVLQFLSLGLIRGVNRQ